MADETAPVVPDPSRIYPRWIYSPTADPILCMDFTADLVFAKVAGWYDTPDDFPADSAATAATECPYCKIYQGRIQELETQIVDLEKAKAT